MPKPNPVKKKSQSKLNPETKKSLAKAVKEASKKREPLWKGPVKDGVTQSLLGRFIVCRERFRCLVVEGLKTEEGFNHRLEYGSMWHICEEALALGGNPIVNNPVADPPWLKALKKYCQGLALKYREQQDQVQRWYSICKLQFPIYVEWWKKHPDVKKRKPLFQEREFSVLRELPSTQKIRLRGKLDAVDIIDGKLWLQENKTKSDYSEHQLKSQLFFDLQTMFYLTALEQIRKEEGIKEPIGGIRYNVVRRPLGGGKYSIQQRKGRGNAKTGVESDEEFYARLADTINEAVEPEGKHYFFTRLQLPVSQAHLRYFQIRCLDPNLEQLILWWRLIEKDPFNPWSTNGQWKYDWQFLHTIHPYGLYNPMDDGISSPLDEFIYSGDNRGLFRTDNLFPELSPTE